MNPNIPPPPPGFVPEEDLPPPPQGFERQGTPPPPPGFVMEERQYPEASNQPGFLESLRHGAGNVAQGFTHGVRRALPPVDMALGAVGLEHPGPTEGSFVGKAAEYAGEMAPAGVAGTAAIAQRGTALLRNPMSAAKGRVQGVVDNLGQVVQRDIATRPGRTAAVEAGALAGAGAMYAAAEDSALPGAQAVAGAVGSLAGGGVVGAPRWAADRAVGGLKTVAKHIPGTKWGAEMRVNAQRQDRASNLDAARQAVRDGPRDIPPARLTEQPHLIAEQRRAMSDDPNTALVIQNMEAQARRTREGNIRGMAGAGRDEAALTRSVMQQAAPPGVHIEPAPADQMIQQVRAAYGPAYRQFQGRAQTRGMGVELKKSLDEIQVRGHPSNREEVTREIRGLTQDVNRRLDPATGEADVQDLLWMRSEIRKMRNDPRLKSPDRAYNEQYRGLYDNVEGIITRRINDALPPDQLQKLVDVDASYRQYSTVRDSMKRGEGLSMQRLGDSLARRTSPTEWSEGGGGPLRELTRQGTPVEKLWGDPLLAETTVQNASPSRAKVTRGEFILEMVNRSSRVNRNSGEVEISGIQLQELLRQQEPVLRKLQISDKELTTLRRNIHELVMLERNPDVRVDTLMTDTKSKIVDFVTSLIGAAGGSRAAKATGAGGGASLVMAGRGAGGLRTEIMDFMDGYAKGMYTHGFRDHGAYLKSLTGQRSIAKEGTRKQPRGMSPVAPLTGDIGQTAYEEGQTAYEESR